MDEKNSAFWDAVRGGKSEELVPTRPNVRPPRERAPGPDPYADVEDAQVETGPISTAVDGLPQDVEVAEGRSRKLLVFIGVPVVLMLAIIVMAGGGGEPATTPTPPTPPTFEAVPIAPESPIKRNDTPREIVAKAKESLVEQYGGKQLPSSTQMAAYLEEQLKLEVSDKSTRKPNVLELMLLPTGRVLLSYEDPNGLVSISQVNLDQAPDS